MWLLDYFEKRTYIGFRNQIIDVLERNKGKKVAVWGAGVRGIVTGIVLEELGVYDFFYIDSDKERQGKSMNGHMVYPIHEVDLENTYIILSMEYQSAVKNVLSERGLGEGKNFYGLVSHEDGVMLERLSKNTGNRRVVLGASVLDIVGLGEKEEQDLAEYIENSLDDVKVLGISNLTTEMMYYLIEMELFRNRLCEEIILLIDLKEFTTYHDKLPRTQKPELLRMLRKLAYKAGNDDLVSQIDKVYALKERQSEEYELENKYSPNRIEGEYKKRLAQYLQYSVEDILDTECGEMKYLVKIFECANTRGIKVTLFIQPLNVNLCKELCGEAFDNSYEQKRRLLQLLANKYGAVCVDAGELLSKEDFISINSPNDAILSAGRKKFAKYITDFIRKDEYNADECN